MPVLTLTRILAAGIGGGLILGALLGYRTDYVGHFLAGFGGTLALLAFPLADEQGPLHWTPLGIAVLAILLGAAAEQFVFRIAIFDPVDFYNQSLGAALAAMSVQGREPSPAVVGRAGVLAIVFLLVGAGFAFA